MVTCERLREVVSYDPVSGEFRWRSLKPSKKKVGDVAGSFSSIYVRIRIDGVLYPAHRLAWLYMTGEWPSQDIDHCDRNPKNNAFSNLRLATHSQNMVNKILKPNASGHRGVYWDTVHKWWYAQIRVDGKLRTLGTRAKLEDAIAIRKEAEKKFFGEFMPD